MLDSITHSLHCFWTHCLHFLWITYWLYKSTILCQVCMKNLGLLSPNLVNPLVVLLFFFSYILPNNNPQDLEANSFLLNLLFFFSLNQPWPKADRSGPLILWSLPPHWSDVITSLVSMCIFIPRCQLHVIMVMCFLIFL